MPTFHYQGLNAAHQLVAGEIEADGVGQAIAKLEADGLTVQSIGYASPMSPFRSDTASEPPRRTSFPAADVESGIVHSHIKQVLARGSLLVPALRAYADEMPSSRRRR